MSIDEPTAQPWPDYLLARALREPPADSGVVPGSTPVVSFGHPLLARVATLGINPSSGEFLGNGALLHGSTRRLATLPSLGVSAHGDLTRAHAAQVLDDCAAYFERRPYRWFTPLDQILKAALSASYFDATACHLDLVQWATDPIWKDLSPEVRAQLLEADLPFLKQQLQHENYRVVVVAGRTALEGVEASGLVRWEHVARLDTKPAADVYVATLGSARFVGWSCNIQSQAGARVHIPRLIELLREHGKEITMSDTVGSFERGTHFRSREDLVVGLRAWLAACDDATVGDPSNFAGTPWILFSTAAGDAAINADTTREAVQRMLASVDAGAPWSVIENTRGRVNKVVFDRTDSHAGWYAYLRSPVAAPTEL